MTREEAKEILIRVRPMSADEAEPDVAEALRMAQTDPELKAWLLGQQSSHGAVRDGLRAIAAPSDLQARILAEAHLTQSPPRVELWDRRQWLAIAALFVLMLVGAALWQKTPRERATFENFRSRMTGFAARTYRMDILTTDAAAVRKHLAERGGPADFPLPPAVEKLPVKGGGRLSWQNHPVSMMCFALGTNDTLFVFVVDQNLVAGPKVGPSATVTPGTILSTASWSERGKVYLMAAKVDGKVLANLAAHSR